MENDEMIDFNPEGIDFLVKQVNDIILKPVINNKLLNDEKNIYGGKFFKNPWSNTFICAKKNSGKTNIIYHIIKNCAHKNTRVILICGTVNIDPTYKKMCDMMEKKKIRYDTFTSFVDDDTGENVLSSLLDELKNPEEPEENNNGNLRLSDEEEGQSPYEIEHEVKVIKKGIDYGDTRIVKKKKKKKPKKKKPELLYSKIILVIDDIGSARLPVLSNLMKQNRHHHMRILVSSQHIFDLPPSALKQLDYCLVFKSLNQEKIERLKQDLDIGNLTTDEFYMLYKELTEEKYSFMYIDVRNETYRQNFNIQIEIKK